MVLLLAIPKQLWTDGSRLTLDFFFFSYLILNRLSSSSTYASCFILFWICWLYVSFKTSSLSEDPRLTNLDLVDLLDSDTFSVPGLVESFD